MDAVEEPQLILDCGANVGYTAVYFLTRFPRAKLIAIEPDLENFDLLQRNLAPFRSRSTALRSAIWSHETGLTWEESSLRAGNEMGRELRPPHQGEEPVMMGTTILDLLNKSGLDRVDILKIDIERAEKDLFESNFEPWLSRTDHIVIELHDKECKDIFFQAIADQNFAISNLGELTVCHRRDSGKTIVPEKTTGSRLRDQ